MGKDGNKIAGQLSLFDLSSGDVILTTTPSAPRKIAKKTMLARQRDYEYEYWVDQKKKVLRRKKGLYIRAFDNITEEMEG